ncbi:hypothetical protein F4821DRAFT_260987 [Hypoxylon rubiginosum]|uniref:Uncharacterized protein n=1 Tax=Hypoxylon rubiginosum TaxID=110542 RepID=A0ACC0CYH1_9PEZI|nr:hypothetical protein F4821DRAFT_260987 [Hypoxylon rubiginosum]
MSQRSNSADRLEALGLLDYSSDTNNTAPSSGDDDVQDVSKMSNSDADAPTAIENEFKTSPSADDKSKPEEESKSKQRHRTLAYETLMGLSHGSEKKSREGRRQRRHPDSLRPGSTPAVGTKQHSSAEPREARPASSNWKPHKPAYAQLVSDSNTKRDSASSVPPLSRYDAYQPLAQEQLPEERERYIKPRPSTLGLHEVPVREEHDSDLRSSPSNATYPLTSRSTEPVSRRGRIAERTGDNNRNRNSRSVHNRTPRPSFPVHNTSSGISNSPAESSRMTRPRQRQRQRVVTTSSTSSFSSSVPPSSSSFGRSPSPGRGAWISDAPHQERPSLAVRARERMHKRLRLRRPRSSFEVRGVVKSPVADVVTSNGGWRTAHPAAMPSEYSSVTESDVSESDVSVAELEGSLPSLSSAELEGEPGENQYYQERERYFRTPTQETVRTSTFSVDGAGAGPRVDELFLEDGSLEKPGQRSLFPSEWSRKERVHLEQEKVDSYFVAPASKPDGQQSVTRSQAGVKIDESGPEALALNFMMSGAQAVPGARGTDDRHRLPSQHSRARPPRPESLPSNPLFCETPDRMSMSGEKSFGPRSLKEEGMGNWI